MDIIPAIDLLGGRCVRLYQGDFQRVTTYEQDPVELAGHYRAAGPRILHVVDLDGARTGVPANLETIRRLAGESGMLIQTGGGIRNEATLDSLLQAGAARIVIGSIAVTDPSLAAAWLERAGPERLVLAFDVRCDDRETRIATHGWQETTCRSLWEIADQYIALGARHLLCTDVGRDGTLAGTNLALYAECARRYPQARWQASGGLGSAADLSALAATGVASVITGRALLDGRLTLEEVGRFLRAA
jgi:phosphoribosylformimino-5-aminoimidazole carboxamide ribotide isomerase